MATLTIFERSYLECALWSSWDDSGDLLDASYTVDDFEPDQIAKAVQECANFREYAKTDLENSGLTDEQQGCDFWLTRNRHGAGFWDRGLGEIGKRLTDAAHSFGFCDLYIGDDGKLYFS